MQASLIEIFIWANFQVEIRNKVLLQNWTPTANVVILSKTYHSLNRLSPNGMKLSKFIGFVNVSIAVDLKVL
jgi:hypothetical protein